MEPVGVMACAGLMCMASVEVLRQSVEALLGTGEGAESAGVDATPLSVAVVVAVILSKLVLWRWCGLVVAAAGGPERCSSVAALAQDHGNDVATNLTALLALWLAGSPNHALAESLWWVDPAAAIALSLYILWSWIETALEQVEFIVGKSASQSFLREVRAIADSHHGDMVCDQLRAYHFGPRFLVEVEVVLPPATPLRVSHDLGMELQWKIEEMEDVERCFVHIDYEKRPYDEHQLRRSPANSFDEHYFAAAGHATTAAADDGAEGRARGAAGSLSLSSSSSAADGGGAHGGALSF
jgi:divalent metal cation (Fe/Co/Zn/Cd) transporter